MADRRPALIARCADVDDVVTAIRFAREKDLVVAVRGGGHSVAGFSTCDGGIIIDLSLMRGLTVDPERRVARAEGGAHLSQLDKGAQEFGLACPVGVVGHTGVAGLTLGGGMGRLQRKYGCTIDTLLAVDLVAADGRRLHASDDENADLFWGIRGAGANFGVVTSFELRLSPVETNVTHGWIAFPIERSREVAALVREFLTAAADEAWLSAKEGAIARVPDDAMAFTGRTAAWWVGLEAAWEGAELDEPHKAWSRQGMAALTPFTTVGQYVNDAVDSDVGSVRAIYGNEKYDRLVRLKRAHDPDNIFRLNANIRP